MYITKISLNSFKAHFCTNVKLKNGLNFILGPNGLGKSSILEALSYALVGTTASGAPKKELITEGQKSGSVSITFDNGYELVRTLDDKIKLFNDNKEIITDKTSGVETWLGMSKDLFSNILYASQGEIYDLFSKFNAKQKDFMDSIFNIDSFIGNVPTHITSLKSSIEKEITRIETLKMQKNSLEQGLKNILTNEKIKSMDELTKNIEDLQQELNVLQNITDVSKYNDTVTRTKSIYNTTIENLNNYNKNIDLYKNEVLKSSQVLEEKIKEAYKLLKLPDDTQFDFEYIKNTLYSLCDIKKCLDQIITCSHKGLESTTIDEMKEIFNKIIQLVQYIESIDNYRNYYNSLINNINIAMNNSTNSKNNYNRNLNEIDKLNNTVKIAKENFDNAVDALKKVMPDANSYNDKLKLYMEKQNKFHSLSATKNNILNYVKEIGKINYDENQYQQFLRIRSDLKEIDPLFGRDGFSSYMRNELLNDFANTVENQLERFSFNSITPITISNDGTMLFKKKRFKSGLSGAQKIIVAIIMRLIYSRMIAPHIKLSLMLLDEPTSDLDAIRVIELRDFLNDLTNKLSIQLLIITHDENLITPDSNIINLACLNNK